MNLFKYLKEEFEPDTPPITWRFNDQIHRIQTEYQIRNFIDQLDRNGYRVFAEQFFRFEPFELRGSNVHWLGPLSENQIWVDGDDNFKDLPDNFLDLPDDFDLSNWDILELPDGFSFRLLLQLTIAQSTQKSYLKQVDLYMNQQALSNQRKCWDMTPRLELMDGLLILSIQWLISLAVGIEPYYLWF